MDGGFGGGRSALKRGSVIALTVAAALLVVGPVTYAASLQQLQQQELQAQQQLAQEEQQYNETQSAINRTEGEMNQLNQDLVAARSQIGSTSTQIRVTDQHIQVTQNLLNATQMQLTRTEQQLASTRADYQATRVLVNKTHRDMIHQSHMLSGQLQLIEERGSVGYLDVILGAHSFSDFISRAELLGQVASSAAQELKTIKSEEAAYTLDEANLQKETSFLTQATASINQHKTLLANEQSLLTAEKQHAVVLNAEAQQAASSLANGLVNRQHLVGQLQAQKGQLASGMSSLQSRISSLVSEIQSLMSQFNAGGLTRQALYNAMLPLVSPIAQQWGVPAPLVIAVITEESGGNSQVVSSAGAIGLMQVEPGTAQVIAAHVGLSASTVMQELYNPEDNVELGTYYLHYLLGTFGGNVDLAIAGYNAGPGAVQQYGGIPPYPQTQQYVRNVSALYQLYSSY